MAVGVIEEDENGKLVTVSRDLEDAKLFGIIPEKDEREADHDTKLQCSTVVSEH